jgi:hypothetical protein
MVIVAGHQLIAESLLQSDITQACRLAIVPAIDEEREEVSRPIGGILTCRDLDPLNLAPAGNM